VQVAADGRLEVEVRVPQRTAKAWLAAHLQKVPVGRHVTDAMPDARLLTRFQDVPEAWQPAVTEFALERRPWQR
jgi:hypothetical protein